MVTFDLTKSWESHESFKTLFVCLLAAFTAHFFYFLFYFCWKFKIDINNAKYVIIQHTVAVAMLKLQSNGIDKVCLKSISHYQALIDSLSKGSGNIMDSLPEVRWITISQKPLILMLKCAFFKLYFSDFTAKFTLSSTKNWPDLGWIPAVRLWQVKCYYFFEHWHWVLQKILKGGKCYHQL